eukprot:4748-Rhodomonas_salina.2
MLLPGRGQYAAGRGPRRGCVVCYRPTRAILVRGPRTWTCRGTTSPSLGCSHNIPCLIPHAQRRKKGKKHVTNECRKRVCVSLISVRARLLGLRSAGARAGGGNRRGAPAVLRARVAHPGCQSHRRDAGWRDGLGRAAQTLQCGGGAGAWRKSAAPTSARARCLCVPVGYLSAAEPKQRACCCTAALLVQRAIARRGGQHSKV